MLIKTGFLKQDQYKANINLVFIVGPSAVGKSDWALEWAKQSLLEGQAVGILNCDSIQIYTELNKGSAKPDFAKYPDISFYLYNQIQAPKLCSAGIFRRKALEILEQKLPQERILAVGGSGFYLQALEKGMFPVKASAGDSPPMGGLSLDHSINNSLQKTIKDPSYHSSNTSLKTISDPSYSSNSSLENLYQSLKEQDPVSANRIGPKDRYRILRALELIAMEGKTPSQIQSEFQSQKLPWPYLKVGLHLSKEELLTKVQNRTKHMLKSGLIEEVQSLLKQGFKNWRPLSSIGYKEAGQYLQGSITKPELEDLIVSHTMRLAKKQKTWFKRDTSIKWFHAHLDPLKVYKQIFKC